MLAIRLFCLVAVAYFVDARSGLELNDVAIDELDDILLDSLGDQLVSEMRKRRDVDDEASLPNQAIDQPSNSVETGPCPPCAHPHPHRASLEAHRKMPPTPYNGPPCELRSFFAMPMSFNRTARRQCFDRWEKPAFEARGVDFAKMHRPPVGLRQMGQRCLLVHKGCDTQCMFLEHGLIIEDGENLKISKDAVMAALKEEDDPQEIVDIFEQNIDKCIEESADLIHPKQSCKSGSDEFLECVRFQVNKACHGAKWKGLKSCDEPEDAIPKMRNCRREQRSKIMAQVFMHANKRYRHAEN